MKLDEAIRAAIEYEAGVHRVYREAMERAADAVAKRVFKVLCDEEMNHLNYLRERLDEWQKTGEITVKKLSTSIPTREAIDESLQGLRNQVATKSAGKHDVELEMLRQALAVETRTSDFYREMVRALDGAGQKMFERFVEIEEGHQAVVQAEISSVSGLGYWFDTVEFRLEAG
jgi:rubrerythrin